jgi:hypothetical protein
MMVDEAGTIVASLQLCKRMGAPSQMPPLLDKNIYYFYSLLHGRRVSV